MATTFGAVTNADNQFSVMQTMNAGWTLPSGQTAVNAGTIAGGTVNPASGTVSEGWTVNGQFTAASTSVQSIFNLGVKVTTQNNGGGANTLQLYDSVSGDSAYFRANSGGGFSMLNTAYSATPFTVDDSGNVALSGTVTSTGVVLPGAISTSLPAIYFNSVSSTFVPGTAVGIGLVSTSAFSGLGFFSAGSVGIYNSNATTPGVILSGSGAVQLVSNTPNTTAGALSQQSNGLFLGNGSVAQGIPTSGEYEIATMPLPPNVYVTSSTTFADIGYPVNIDNLPANATYQWEIVAIAADGGQVQLYNVTSAAGTGQITLSATAGYQLVRANIALTAGDEYLVQALTNSSSYTTTVYSARLIAIF